MKHEQRFVTPPEIDAQREGSVVIAPGIWVDRNGDPHFSVPELLAMVDLEDTHPHESRTGRRDADARV